MLPVAVFPTLSKPIAMALLERNSAKLGNTLYAIVRDRKIAVTVTKLPFIHTATIDKHHANISP